MRADLRPLTVTELTVCYGTRSVLDALSLRVETGEVYGLLGSNGAGKTTLIRAICGLVRPRSGTIEVAGETGERRRRHIGLVPQELALYPHLTIRENLEVFGQLSGIPRRELGGRIAWAAEAACLDERMGERVEQLSGGWKRRANIAAAILHRPRLLILDEPTTGVDLASRSRLHEVVLELSRAGMGVLLTTHDLDQAETLCARVGLLRDGRMVLEGAPRQLIRHAFGARKEIIVDLRGPASQGEAGLLARAGFQPGDGGGASWIRRNAVGEGHLDRLAAELGSAGLEVRTIRLREPGLDSLLLQVSGDQAEPVH